MQKKRQQLSIHVIKTGRRLFANTPANDWRITGKVKGKIFQLGNPDTEGEIEYLGAKLIVPTNDNSIVPGLVGGYYERLELELFRELTAQSRTVLDVGGNIGLYASIGGVTLPDSGHLYSFEPIPTNITFLRRNITHNDLDAKATVVEAAVGDEPGEMKIYLSKGNVSNHSASAKTAHGDGEFVSVKKVTLDDFVTENQLTGVDILKIDVEGFDGHVLRGAAQLLATQKPTLFVEFIPRLLQNCGFEPEEFIKLFSEHYEHCFLVNEHEDRLVRVPLKNANQIAAAVENANLILTNNPAHLSWVTS